MAIMKVTFASEVLSRCIDLNVIVPMETLGLPGAEATEKKRLQKFKTLYLLHGYGGNQNDWLTYSNIRVLAEMYGIAVVLPAGENSFYVDGQAVGTRWGEMVGSELISFTRQMFPLSEKREDTFIGGLSMGGFGALRLGSCYHQTFSKIFCLSGAFVIDDIAGKKEDYSDGIGDYYCYHHIFGDLERLKDSPKDPLWCVKQAIEAGSVPQVYMACGIEDFLLEKNREMRKQLEVLRVQLDYVEVSGAHDWMFWNKQLEPAIQWMLHR
ncbi:hypothetical protein IMSAGC011_01613 [Lachnospiraceae bacterium]|nr:hypothetical protein IMSAGC011_01613 [Lachnospiraceae bacterium]